MRFRKANLKCFKCHQKEHVAREFKEAKVEQYNAERRLVSVPGIKATASGTSSSQAMVAQSGEFDWAVKLMH